MRTVTVGLSIALLAAAPAGARLVSAGPGQSWGKAGVSLAQYRADAIACGHEAAAYDLKGSDPARALIVASRMMDNEGASRAAPVGSEAGGPSAASDPLDLGRAAAIAKQMVDPQRQFAKAGELLENALEQCLTKRGYRKFGLTKAQRSRLAKLATGSDARHAYLHSLASDPAVLEQQPADD